MQVPFVVLIRCSDYGTKRSAHAKSSKWIVPPRFSNPSRDALRNWVSVLFNACRSYRLAMQTVTLCRSGGV
ncbi:hypothetical protein IAQ61_004818 [Plenodomus lingam]|uniref:uncharacterized protein n=1 Tax=Leptosphaeria maculans TaxID=5022 RepID=UPI00332A4331|nr:hypothetical protein IAQ61_004818 [Plenodomus lingam]